MPSLFSWFNKDATATKPQRIADSTQRLPSTEFAFRLFEKLNPGELNLAVCPYGARVVLSMLWEGSTGETRKEMSNALHFNAEGISECNPLYLAGVLQNDFVEVNEKGTEAAAVTEVMLDLAGLQAPPPPPFEMIVDRPFLFAICDDYVRSVVFLGAVADPLASGPARAGE